MPMNEMEDRPALNFQAVDMPEPLPWYALQTKARHEKVVSNYLKMQGVEEFLPLYKSRREWSDRVTVVELPLFGGYIFCRTGTEFDGFRAEHPRGYPRAGLRVRTGSRARCRDRRHPQATQERFAGDPLPLLEDRSGPSASGMGLCKGWRAGWSGSKIAAAWFCRCICCSAALPLKSIPRASRWCADACSRGHAHSRQ